MGAVALARQTLLDADWYGKAWAAWQGERAACRGRSGTTRWPLWRRCLGGNQPAIIDAANEQFFLRADRFAREFGLTAIIHGSGREYRRLDEIAATGRAVIVPVNFPQPPSVARSRIRSTLRWPQLMHWDIAPENPARLDAAGVPIALTSHGLRDQATFLAAVRRAVERGLKPDSALKAVTTTPAALRRHERSAGQDRAGHGRQPRHHRRRPVRQARRKSSRPGSMAGGSSSTSRR